MTNRRGFLLGLGAALAAPSIVRAESLMKIAQLRQPKMLTEETMMEYLDLGNGAGMEYTWTESWYAFGVGWRRIKFDENLQAIAVEDVFPELPFSIMSRNTDPIAIDVTSDQLTTKANYPSIT